MQEGAGGGRTHELGLPPIDLEVVGLVLQSPEEAITAADEIAQSSRRENEEREHAQNVQPGRGIVLALCLLADLGASGVLGSSLFAGVWLSLAHLVGHCENIVS